MLRRFSFGREIMRKGKKEEFSFRLVKGRRRER